MSDNQQQEETPLETVKHQLQRYRRLRHKREPSSAFNQWLARLQNWQTQRLKRSHHNLFQDPNYKPAAQFFANDLYGDVDFSALDAELERALPKISRIMPEEVMTAAARALELNALSGELDEMLTETLFEAMGVEQITADNYAQAYRRCNNREWRAHQIRLVRQTGDAIEHHVNNWFVYSTLKVTGRPARMAGVGTLHDFLLRGFSSFRQMKDARPFLEQIERVETRIMDNLFEQQPEPFRID